jgi:ABC-type multidrug transport system permease subunit
MKKKTVKKIGWLLILLGSIAFAISLAAFYFYFQIKAATIENENPATFWNALGLIYAYASLGSIYLTIALAAAGIGILFIFIGIVCLRR